jgi:hypothetical protein
MGPERGGMVVGCRPEGVESDVTPSIGEGRRRSTTAGLQGASFVEGNTRHEASE